jgi:hypothetical protein
MRKKSLKVADHDDKGEGRSQVVEPLVPTYNRGDAEVPDLAFVGTDAAPPG